MEFTRRWLQVSRRKSLFSYLPHTYLCEVICIQFVYIQEVLCEMQSDCMVMTDLYTPHIHPYLHTCTAHTAYTHTLHTCTHTHTHTCTHSYLSLTLAWLRSIETQDPNNTSPTEKTRTSPALPDMPVSTRTWALSNRKWQYSRQCPTPNPDWQ